MNRFILIITLIILQCLPSLVQAKNDSLAVAVKLAILNNDLETALIHIPNLDIDEKTKAILKKQALNQNLTTADHIVFLDIINKTKRVNVLEFSAYIERNIPTPSTTEPINYDYTRLKWQEITWLVDDSEFDKAAVEQNNLETYINSFDPEERDVKRAKILLQTYHLVMRQVQSETEEGLKLSKECEEKALALNDTFLVLMSRYYYNDFLIYTGNLELFIQTCKESLELENQLQKQSPYYTASIMHLIDAYLFKGGHEKDVYPLIISLLDDYTVGAECYSYVVNYLEKTSIPSPESDTLFSRFGASDMATFCVNLDSLAKAQLNSIDYYYVLFKLSKLNEAQGDLNEALLYLHDANKAIRKTYSKDLAESLTNYETTLLKQSQKQKLENERQKSELSIVISILSFLLFFITIILFWQRNKKEKMLEERNQEITRQRDDIKQRDQEKALLLKEIHHRVKNNFQIVSSLLELQSSSIKDAEAKALVKEGKNRINSMALIHKKLYENDNLKMHFDEYISKLVNDLSVMYNKTDLIEVNISVPQTSFDIDTAIPLGLIINELVTNALKYGMTNEKPKLSISITHNTETEFLLKIRDNGMGVSEDWDITKSKSLGLNIVSGLSKQLNGNFNFVNDNGAVFLVTFKDSIIQNKG